MGTFLSPNLAEENNVEMPSPAPFRQSGLTLHHSVATVTGATPAKVLYGYVSMSPKLSLILKKIQETGGVDPTLREYEERSHKATSGDTEAIQTDYRKLSNLYYDLVTDFYEFGWGKSFHFAPLVQGESFKASLARHEHYLATVLGLRPGMVVADLGCGVGGPLL